MYPRTMIYLREVDFTIRRMLFRIGPHQITLYSIEMILSKSRPDMVEEASLTRSVTLLLS